jgi:NADPH:quinone reductase-like Zn-dependent oxidoreductase
MRAISQDRFGGPEVLQEIELERPEPGPTEVLVRVHAAGVNPTDWKLREAGELLEPPFVLGWDVSGTVEDVGIGSALYKPGDEVFGMLRYPFSHGAYAEYVAAPSRTFARKPPGIDHVQAAAIPLAGLTAWQALVDIAEVAPGQRVLVHAAAGGVGHFAVQIAKARGAFVIGTASAAKHDFVRGLGADEVIDYRSVAFEDVLSGADEVDVVIDTIGGEYWERSLSVVRPGGAIVALVLSMGGVHRDLARQRGVRAATMLVEPDYAAMNALADLVRSGRLRPEIAAVLPLAEAAKAHRLGETNHITGKIVLTP